MLPGDIYYSRRNESNDAFIEKRLVPVANQFVICGPCGDLTTFTGSAYLITSSWSVNADVSVSSSYAMSSSWAPSIESQWLVTSSLYPITSSWAESASWAPQQPTISSSYSATSSFALNSSAGGTLLTTSSLYPITSSWAITSSNSISASYALSVDSQWLVTGSLYPITGSNSITSSYAVSSSYASNVQWLVTGSSYPITSSWSINADTSSVSVSSSYAISASWAPSGQWLVTGSLYPITSSWSTTSSNVIGDGTIQGSTYQVTGSIFNYQTDAYTLTNNDNGRVVSIANDNSSVNLNISRSLDSTFNCMIYQSGSGQVVFVTESGVNIRSRSGASQTSGQYAIATILRVSSTDFIVAGDISV